MSVAEMVRIGSATAQTVIDAAARSESVDVATLRAGVLEFLRAHAAQVSATDEEPELLIAYRDWLEIAVTLYSTGDETKVREYMHRGAVLGAELDLVAASEAG